MKKFRLSTWLGSGSTSDAAEGDETKQNRRSFSPFSARPSAKVKDEISTEASASKDAYTMPESPVSSPSRLTELAKKIALETEKLEKYMQDNSLPMPTLDPSGPGDFPKLPEDIQKSRMEIIYATRELEALAHGPREDVRWKTWSVSKPLDAESSSSNLPVVSR